MDNLRRVRRIVVGRVTTMTTTIVVEMTERKLMNNCGKIHTYFSQMTTTTRNSTTHLVLIKVYQ